MEIEVAIILLQVRFFFNDGTISILFRKKSSLQLSSSPYQVRYYVRMYISTTLDVRSSGDFHYGVELVGMDDTIGNGVKQIQVFWKNNLSSIKNLCFSAAPEY